MEWYFLEICSLHSNLKQSKIFQILNIFEFIPKLPKYFSDDEMKMLFVYSVTTR